MATRTTTTTGNWSSAIWDGAVPVPGDDVVLNHAVVWNTSFSVKTLAINAAVTTSGTGRVFTITDSVTQGYAPVTIGAGNTLAGTTATPWQISTGYNPAATELRLVGTSGSHVAVRDFRFTNGGNNGGGIVVADWTDFLRVGDAAHFAFSPFLGGWSRTFRLSDCTLTSCGQTAPVAATPDVASSGFHPADSFILERCTWTSTAAATAVSNYAGLDPTTGTWTIGGNDFDAFVDLFSRGFTLSGNIYRAAWELDGVAQDPTGAPAATLALSGPSWGALSVASGNFTVTPDGSYTGTVTPATDGAGTFTPASLTWSGTSEVKTFTHTPSTIAGSPHAVSIASSPALAHPGSPIAFEVTESAERPFSAALASYAANRAGPTWDNQGGPAKFAETICYPAILASVELHNHYDPIYCYFRSNQDAPSSLYADCIPVALYQYRDMFIRPYGGGVQGYHVNSLGMRVHYEHTGDLISRDGVLQLNLSAYGTDSISVADPIEGTHAIWTYSRELAYALNALLDAERVGIAHRTRCDQLAATCLSHLRQWVDPTFTSTWWEPACVNCQPFMLGLTLRALIQYWDRHRNAVVPGIPAAVKAGIDWLDANAWEAATQSYPYWVESTAPMSGNPDCGSGHYAGAAYDGETQPSPYPGLNLFVAPAFAWYARYSGDTAYLDRFDEIFVGSMGGGGVDGTLRPYHEKEHHQQYLWGPRGLDWRAWALSPPPEATTYTLSRMGTGSVRANHLAVQLVVELPASAGRATPLTITPTFSTGRGRAVPATQVLTTDEPRAVFLIALDPLDDGASVTISTANSGSLTNPAGIAIAVSGVAPFATSIAYDPPTPVPGRDEYGTFTARLVPAGSVPPASADVRGGAIRLMFYDGYAGGYWRPGALFLTGDYPEATFGYMPAAPATRNLEFYDDVGWTVHARTYTAGSPLGVDYAAEAGDQEGEGGPIPISLAVISYLNGGLTVQPEASDGGTFDPPEVRFWGLHRTATVDYTPASAGTKTITLANLEGFIDPDPLVVEATGDPAPGRTLLLDSPAGGILMISRP